MRLSVELYFIQMFRASLESSDMLTITEVKEPSQIYYTEYGFNDTNSTNFVFNACLKNYDGFCIYSTVDEIF